ncbi:ATP-dependent translocase ABCB1-like [Parasteatoda tepidariorum]|uniref:ATP-dependent translocase ABCB1-like n=1 Tax=Parasteatoda tepidariorum TaxID=114398 RepID=UPI001C726FD5|nr:ATP-dependent translocase ABCB1-like [Parasteatoda tepidariorum]
MSKKEELEDELPSVSFLSLFRYSSACDKLLLFIGAIAAIISGCTMPGMTIVLGSVIQEMIDYDKSINNISNKNVTREDFLESATMLCIYFAAIGGVMLICSYIFVCSFNTAATNQAFRIRCLFMSSILKQDIEWYDTHETGDFASRITG